MPDIAMTPLPGFTFGCDPELFLIDTFTGKVVSAEGIVPGTKAEPYKVQGGALQVDGMAAEFNIDPADNFKTFNSRIDLVLRQLRSLIGERYEFSFAPSVVFAEDVWDKAPDTAKELGCTPDFNAWTGDVNPPPELPDNPRLRTASGHLHIGWTHDEDLTNEDHIKNCRDLVQQFDWYLGAWSLKMDSDPTRRLLYGKAGACRYKPYGVEYRVLSNFWLTTRDRRMAVWNRMQRALVDMRNNFIPDQYSPSKGGLNHRLQESINTSVRNPQLESEYEYPIRTIR